MSRTDMEVRRECGCVLVEHNKLHANHRYWFDETEDGNLVFCQEAMAYDASYSFMVKSDGRNIKEPIEMELTDDVREALREAGYDGKIVDTDGKIL